MKNQLEAFRLIEKNSSIMGGVFTLSDLQILFGTNNRVLLHRRIQSFEENDILFRFCRGFYVTQNCDLEMLSARIYPASYISFGTVLARSLLIGSVPEKTVTAVKRGRNREFSGICGTIVYVGCAEHVMTGYLHEQKGNYALPEKAVLDVLYYYQKGHRFSFDPFSDIDFSRLNRERLQGLLCGYRNPKFRSFVEGIFSGNEHE
jgi:hypothetical protein